MSITAKVFMSGRSQAIRLPAKLRLQSKEVQIEQIGDALWLMPQTGVNQDMGQWLTAFYANTEPLPDDFLNDRKDLPLQERDWSRAGGLMRKTLDTNICSYILRQHPTQMLEKFLSLDRQQLWLSAVVAAELRFGVAKLGVPKFASAVESWLSGFDVQAWPLSATHTYASTRATLEKKGQMIGAMDLMIAAHALAEDSVLITNNAKEFQRVPGLAIETWGL